MSLMLKAARAGRTGTMVGLAHRRVMRGDPGLFGFLGKVAKGAIGGAVGFATGGVGGALAGIRGTLARPAMPGTGLVQQLPPPPPIGPNVTVPFPGPGQLRIDPLAALPGGAPLFARTGAGLACPKGFHPNRATYFLKDGTRIDAGTRCVKNRSRNPLNPRALRRAIGRIDAGKVWQSKLAEITTARRTAAGNKKD